MKKKPIILVGAGGHCISCIDIIEVGGKYNIIGILDLSENVGKKILGYDVIGTDEQIKDFAKECPEFLITVGQIKSSNIRKNIYKEIKIAGGKLPVIISPHAYLSKHAAIDEGTIIMHHSLVNAGAKVGKCAIVNSKALIEHETTVGNFCHISTEAVLNGQSKTGDNCFLGSNTVIGNNISICDNAIISAGSQVLKDIKLPGVYIGNPLRKIR